MSGLPPIDTIRHLLERLRANDISWFRERYKSGDLAWLQDHLPEGEYAKLGADFEAGNLDRLRGLLPGIPGLREMPGIGALLGGLGGLGGVAGAAGAAGAVGAAMRDRAATGATRMGSDATTGITRAVETNENRRKPIAWLIPVAILAALAAILGLTQCNKDDKKTTVETTLAASAVTEAVGTEAPATDVPVTEAAGAASGNIIETALGAGKFSTLGAAITAAGLGETLAGPGPFTVFAPNDAAFASLPPGVLDALLKPENKDALAKILTYHVVPGKVMAADVKTGPVKSVEGDDLNLKAENGAVTVNDATVLSADVAASNGVIHEIDKVLLPPGFDPASLGAAATTVAAATATTTAEATPTTPAAAAADKDIIDTAVGAGSFTTLAAALNAAGLVDTLKGAGPFTVFAPTDDAFKALPAGLVDALLKPENKDVLVKILTYHVVPGKVLAADVKTGKVKTVEGDEIDLKVDGTTVMVNDATVTKADIATSNGVIHVIDKVLLPPGVDPAALLGPAPAETTVAEATPTSIASVGAPENLTVYFDSGKSAIKADEQAKITGAVDKLAALPAGSKVNIVGHADKNGDAKANQVLSVRRATEVEKALKAGLGAKASNITFTVGAVGDTQAETDPAKARKVTIEILPTA